ncbi:flagellar hook capping FlgD N-terminal domain-containing protein [Loktanella sp. SALINAS62]|uniref:flagellar hook capping FlgD N-terminal domain-containing protein n=1 Tax=Loktanella sp. SALINAS62 TaxID=2706124 RepID=UPI001B8D3B4E|nr:flagellar hook capping FlgD N-terminal domain-containing protein [Loktanella sp. SALINAS62]MBS1301873.1 flagellar basal body rod modification protein [Loktanella sp. SALINAS62]
MDMTQIQQPPATGVPASAVTAATSNGIGADFERFLKMLTVQMQNQDPLDPIDSADYATQLATFSGVEQQVQTNDLLRIMTGQMAAGGLSQLAGWVGMEARTEGAVQFDGTPVTLVPNIHRSADDARLVVRDVAGTEVQRIHIPTDNAELTWAGVTTDGAPLPVGRYSFETVSIAGGEVLSQDPISVYGKVAEVRLEEGQNMVVLTTGQKIPAAEVTAVRDPALRRD